MNEKKDNDDRWQNDEDIQEIFENLGEDLSKLLGKLAEKGAEMRKTGGFGFFQDLEKMMSKDVEFGLDHLEEFFKNFSPQDFGSGYDKGTTFKDKKKREKEDTVQEPTCDVFDENEEILIYVELPGVDEEDISIKKEGKNLWIKAKHENSTYEKEIKIPQNAKGMPSYTFKNGILKIRFAKEGSAN